MLTFDISFHGPFRIGTGTAGRGLDDTVDHADPLGASSLKGVMAHAARDLLGIPDDWLRKVFGGPRQPSPWAWSDAHLHDVRFWRRAAVRIDDVTGAASDDMLSMTEETWARSGSFSIQQIGDAGGPFDVHTGRLVLRAAGAAVTSIGADRRRGLGWVTVTPQEPLGDDAVATLITLRSGT